MADVLRTCSACGRQALTVDDLEVFGKNPRAKYGRSNRCKPCIREYWQQYYSGSFRDRLVWDVREMSYKDIHRRLNAHFGKAQEYTCICGCGSRASQWAYTVDDPDPRFGASRRGTVTYSLLPEYYQPMARACHAALDAVYRRGT